MNKYYLMSSILSAVFVIYMWVVYLPEYQGSEYYPTQLTVVTVTSLVMIVVMLMMLYLARGPITEGEEKKTTPANTRKSTASKSTAIKDSRM